MAPPPPAPLPPSATARTRLRAWRQLRARIRYAALRHGHPLVDEWAWVVARGPSHVGQLTALAQALGEPPCPWHRLYARSLGPETLEAQLAHLWQLGDWPCALDGLRCLARELRAAGAPSLPRAQLWLRLGAALPSLDDWMEVPMPGSGVRRRMRLLGHPWVAQAGSWAPPLLLALARAALALAGETVPGLPLVFSSPPPAGGHAAWQDGLWALAQGAVALAEGSYAQAMQQARTAQTALRQADLGALALAALRLEGRAAWLLGQAETAYLRIGEGLRRPAPPGAEGLRLRLAEDAVWAMWRLTGPATEAGFALEAAAAPLLGSHRPWALFSGAALCATARAWQGDGEGARRWLREARARQGPLGPWGQVRLALATSQYLWRRQGRRAALRWGRRTARRLEALGGLAPWDAAAHLWAHTLATWAREEGQGP